jgi:hypothetical protein
MTTHLSETEIFKAKVISAAKNNPDLSVDFIKEILLSDAEEASFEYVFG